VCARGGRLRRFAADGSGAAALEFALLGPVFLVFLIGVFQLCWAMYCSNTVRYALHNSGRQLVLNPALTQDQFQTLVRSAVTPLASPNVTVTLTKVSPSTYLQTATATATYTYQIVVPFFPTYNGAYTTTYVQTGTNY
jgi:Flp pilus assembly protein TadG